MDKNKRQQTIEQYLRNELPASDREDFERSMSTDPALSSDVRLHQMLLEEFGDREKQDFINELDALGDRYFGPDEAPPKKGRNRRLFLGIALLVMAGIGLLWLLSPAPAPEEDQPESEIFVPPSPVEDGSAPIKLPEEQTPTDEPATAPQEPTAPQPERTPRPIAQADPADLTPNPYLEDLINSNLRGNELQFSEVEARLNAGRFRLEGQVQKRPADEDRLAIFLYSNKEQDFLDGNPLARLTLDLEPVPTAEEARNAAGEILQTFRFAVEEKASWKPGLYYYFIARESDAEPLYTGKIELPAN